MYIPMFLIITLLIIFLLRRRMYLANKDYGKDLAEYIEAEQAANFARRKNIPEEMFYKPDLAALPLDGYINEASAISEGDSDYSVGLNDDLSWHVGRIVKQAGKKMLKFQGTISNRELKLSFGLANLEFVTEYEENFETYIHYLNDFALALINAGQTEPAEIVLSECVNAGSDISRTYIMLTDIYAGRGDAEGLEKLRENADTAGMSFAVRVKTLDYIYVAQQGLENRLNDDTKGQ